MSNSLTDHPSWWYQRDSDSLIRSAAEGAAGIGAGRARRLAALGQGLLNAALDDGSPPIPPPPPAPASQPHSSLAPLSLSHVVLATGASSLAALALWHLYARWRRNSRREREKLRGRQRLSRRFEGIKHLDPESEGAGYRRCWLWRAFFSSSSTTHAVSSLPKSPSPSPCPSSPRPRASSLLSSLLSSASSAASNLSTRFASAGPGLAACPSTSERLAAFVAESRRLAREWPPVLIVDPTAAFLLIEKMRSSNLAALRQSGGREGNIQLVCSFDHTLTTFTRAPPAEHSLAQHLSPTPFPPPLTSHTLLQHYLPPSFRDSCLRLFQHYAPLEAASHLSRDDKMALVREWWTRLHDLVAVDAHRFTRQQLHAWVGRSVERGEIRLRDGVAQLFGGDTAEGQETGEIGLCARLRLPVLLLSASVHDCVEELLLSQGVRVANSNRDLVAMDPSERARVESSPVLLLSNRIRWSAPPALGRGVAEIGDEMLHPMMGMARVGGQESVLLRQAALHSMPLQHASASHAHCIGFEPDPLVHSLNKSYGLVGEAAPGALSSLALKTNVVLLGSSVSDAAMCEGMEQAWSAASSSSAQSQSDEWAAQPQLHPPSSHTRHSSAPAFPSSPRSPSAASSAAASNPSNSSSSCVLRIGFVPPNTPEERLAHFRAAFDILLFDDQDLRFVHQLLHYLCTDDTMQT